MKNRLEVFLAFVLATGLSASVQAQEARQTLPSDNTVTFTAEETVRMTGEPDLFQAAEQSSPLDRTVSIRVSNVPFN